MLDDEKFDFSKETNIKDKLLRACMEKKKEIDAEHLRRPVTIDELSEIKKETTKIDMNKSDEKAIKINKEK